MHPSTESLPMGDRILLDSSTLIAYLNGGEAASELAAVVIDEFVKRGRNKAVVAMISVMELLVRPLQRGTGPYQHTMNFLTHFPNLELIDIDVHAAHQAANIRAFTDLKPPDALVVATGFVAGVGHLVTNDSRWLTLHTFPHQHIRVCCLKQHVPV